MKNIFLFFCILCVVLFSGALVFAGGVDNRSNYSGEYVRTLNRNAATDSLDAIAYNPAGVMKMQNGLQGNLSVHYVLKDYSNTVNGVVLEQDTPSFVPALFGLYKTDNWAGFFSFTIPAGGGKVDYDSGNATTRIGSMIAASILNTLYGPASYNPADSSEQLSAQSFYYGYTVGGAYKLNDIFSVSLSGRYIDADKKADALLELTPTSVGPMAGTPPAQVALNYEDSAEGYGFILGMFIDYEPVTIGMRYETETDLDFKYNVKQDTVGIGALQGITDGLEHSRNLPALFAFGLGYQANARLKIDLNFTTYFQEDADWGGAENNVENGWEAGIAVEYILNPRMKLSAGYLYTQTGMSARYALKEAPELDANTFGAGFVYHVNESLKIDCGIAMVDYESESYTDASLGTPIVIGLAKDVVMAAAGVQYHF